MNPKKPGFRGGGIQRGQGLPWHTILLARSSVLYLLRLVGAPCARLSPGNRWRACRGFGCASGLLLSESNPLRWASIRLRRAKGTCDGAAQGPFGDPGQAGFAGHLPENAGACRQQSPPGRQRLCALGWSEAEEKRAQPGRRRYIKTLVSVSRFSRFLSAASPRFFRFSQNAPFRKMQKCVIARKRPSQFSANWDSPDRAKSGSPDLRNGAFSSYPIPRD